MEYDSNSDQCVGFVLPIRDGMIQCGVYEATSFDAITEMFKTRPLSKFAYVYVAQALCDGIPSFCLACIGTDNRFDYQSILFRWKYIFSELKKRSIQVINFSSDGDSRLLKAMLIMLSLQKEPSFDPSTVTSDIKLSSQWVDWFILPRLSLFSVSQDTVHLGVKLKARLMKPGILLPLGVYVAAAADLKMIFEHYGKEVHNIRMKDLDHRDRQNFDAVDHLTSEAVITLLDRCGCLGTKVYLKMIRYIIDSFLCKDLEPKKRISQCWTAVFFFRYWRQWILDNSEYNLKNNFITRNAYLCAEINGHCLISFLLVCKSVNLPLMPWLLGSQPCEQLFQAARSMSSVYSTMINFSLLGLLRRLHRIHIQNILEAEGEENGILFPRREQHRRKHGTTFSSAQRLLHNDVSAVTMKDIEDWIEIGKAEAKNLLQVLGMDILLKANQHWNEVSAGINAIEAISTEDLIDGDEAEDDHEDGTGNTDVELCEEQADGIEDDIKCLQESGGISDKNATCMLKDIKFCRLPDNDLGINLPAYTTNKQNDSKSTSKMKREKKKHILFVEVNLSNGRTVYIRKSTLVWILQENERLSSDRLFRVREKQPFSSSVHDYSNSMAKCLPIKASSVSPGDVCVFVFEVNTGYSWDLGKIMQFSGGKRRIPYCKVVSEEFDQISVLCQWYKRYGSENDDSKFEIHTDAIVHEYLPLVSYLCTVYSCEHRINCLVTDCDTAVVSIFQSTLLPGVTLHLTEPCVVRIKEMFKEIYPENISTLKIDKDTYELSSVANSVVNSVDVSSYNYLEALETRKTRSGRVCRPPKAFVL